MRNFFRLFVLFLLAGVVFVSCSKNDDSDLDSGQIIRNVEQYAGDLIKDGKVPGMVIGIWDEKSKINYIKAFGKANIENGDSMKAEHIFRIGSITKTMVATVLLQMKDEGLFKLDDTVSKYLPNVPLADSVTIRQLVNMSSGIPDYTNENAFWESVLEEPSKYKSPDDLYNYVDKKPLLFLPGLKHYYSNTNYIILGQLIEKMSGHKLEEELKTRIFNQLHLNHTELAVNKEMPKGSTHGYMSYEGKLWDVTDTLNPSWAWAAGAVTSNVYDLKTWTESLANGALLMPATHNGRLSDAKLISVLQPNITYGEGIANLRGYLGHNGGYPGYATIAMCNPTTKSTIIVLYNRYDALEMSSSPDELFAIIVNMLYPGTF